MFEVKRVFPVRGLNFKVDSEYHGHFNYGPFIELKAEINNAYGELILVGIVEVNGANSIHEQPEKVVSIHPDKLKRMGLL